MITYKEALKRKEEGYPQNPDFPIYIDAGCRRTRELPRYQLVDDWEKFAFKNGDWIGIK